MRALVAKEAERAAALLNEGTPLVGSVHGRLKVLLAGFVAGGRAALRAVAAAGHDVLPGPPRPTKLSLLCEVGATLRREG
ncbi:Phytoene synthase OS=Streptomyces antimycoticus OX=68175 GN=SANT12839_076450 PE=4 SV=1 [Streptomyces antimycoticus]